MEIYLFSTAQVSHLKPEPISRSSCPDCDSSCFPIIIFNSMNSPCLWQNIPHPAPSSWSSPTEMNSSVLTLPHPFALPCQKCLELFYQVLLINLVFTLNPSSIVCITCFSLQAFHTRFPLPSRSRTDIPKHHSLQEPLTSHSPLHGPMHCIPRDSACCHCCNSWRTAQKNLGLIFLIRHNSCH